MAAYVAAWLACALLAAGAVFFQSSRTITLVSHDAVLRPNVTGHVVVRTGPVLPDVRLDSGGRVGVDVQLGKTDVRSTEQLFQRYGVIASQPEGQEAKVREALTDMAVGAALRGALLGLLPVAVWLLVGPDRRRQLLARVRTRDGAVVAAAAGVVAVAVVLGLFQPWAHDEETVDAAREWVPLGDFLGPAVSLPEAVPDLEVRGDALSDQTRRLIDSAIDTYDRSKKFYADATVAAAALTLRRPRNDETVAALISDRHDNIGMDAVARAIADAAGATAVLDAGDDTSTGRSWEAFSLDSVTAAFEDLDRWAVAGNHDSGDFVSDYLGERGWTMLDGEVVEGPGGSTLLGLDDPRSSGLGTWRDETGLSFDEVADRLADAACDADQRVATLLVHDADLGQPALERGCTDLVLGGHVHVQVGPSRVVGEGGRVGYSYTTGTTGGAAYAIALGSKLRRAAQVSLITYRDGRPVGIQPVLLQTDGRFEVSPWVPLALGEVASAQK